MIIWIDEETRFDSTEVTKIRYNACLISIQIIQTEPNNSSNFYNEYKKHKKLAPMNRREKRHGIGKDKKPWNLTHTR